MPADFSLSESVSCQNLYSGEDLDCSVNSSKKVLVKVSSNRETNSQVSFMAVGLRVGPIYNPDKIIDSAPVTVRILQSEKDRIYVEGTTSIFVKQKGDQSVCPKGCAECAIDGSCIACIKPSATPLLAIETSDCHSICPQGFFQS